jgi:hypothetical protein
MRVMVYGPMTRGVKITHMEARQYILLGMKRGLSLHGDATRKLEQRPAVGHCPISMGIHWRLLRDT